MAQINHVQTKHVFILRHAKSDWSDFSLSDFKRPLNNRGNKAAPKIGACLAEYLKGHGLTLDHVIASTAVRAQETLSHVRLAFDIDGNPILDEHITHREDFYLASERLMHQAILTLPDTINTVLLVGHNPGMEYLAEGLAKNKKSEAYRRLIKKYVTGGLAILELETDGWKNCTSGTMTLKEYIKPKSL